MRILVCVHGACLHTAGFSDRWWQALSPWTDAYGTGVLGETRFEVLWSDLIQHSHADPLQICLADFFQYLDDYSVRQRIWERFDSVFMPLVNKCDQIDIIAHSEGTIVSYESLRQYDHYKSYVLNYFTLGAALGFQYGLRGTDNVRNRLYSQSQNGAKPGIVQSWWNLCANGDPFGSPLIPAYGVTQDFVNLDPTGCLAFPPQPLCCHESYFNPLNLAVNRDILAAKINAT